LSLRLITYHEIKTYGKMQIELGAFLTSAQDDVSGKLHAPAGLPPPKHPPVPTG